MNHRWTQIINTAPDLREPAARARTRALNQWQQSTNQAYPWRLAFLAMAACLALLMLLVSPNPPQPQPAPRQERLVMQMQLSDGTKVHWTFDDRFQL